MLRRNVLIFHQGALGDFVLTWPLALALGRLFAQSKIVYITQSQKGKLAERVLGVDWADVEGGWHQLYSAATELPEAATKLLGAAHSIFSFVARDQRDPWMQNVRTLAPEASILLLDPRPPADYRGHFTDFVIEQLGPIPAVQASAIAMTRTVQERGIGPRAQRAQRVVIHPGSGGEHKCWPKEHFHELSRRLRDAGKSPRIILGEAERERWSAGDIERFREVAEVIEPANLLDLYEELSTAAAAVVNDSGPAHLSGMIATPTLVIFGAGIATIWRPLGPRVELLAGPNLPEIQPVDAYDKLIELLQKR